MPEIPEGRSALSTRREIMLPGMSFRPQRIAIGEKDWRYHPTRSPDDLKDEHRDRTPVALRMESYGAQVGSGWAYSTDPRDGARNRGGLVAGGVAILPPELDMADYLSAFAPQGVTASQGYFVAAAGVRTGWGSPDLVTGGLKDGWSAGGTTTLLTFRSHDPAGAATEIMSVDSSKYVKLATRSSDPTSIASFGLLYVKAGALWYVGTSGTATEVAVA